MCAPNANMSPGGPQPYTHRPVNVYFYIVKYMLGEGWSECVGMSRAARMHTAELLYDLPNIF